MLRRAIDEVRWRLRLWRYVHQRPKITGTDGAFTVVQRRSMPMHPRTERELAALNRQLEHSLSPELLARMRRSLDDQIIGGNGNGQGLRGIRG